MEIAGTDPKNLRVFAIFGLQSGIAAVAAQSDPKRHLSRQEIIVCLKTPILKK
jgi:hypothetical protein